METYGRFILRYKGAGPLPSEDVERILRSEGLRILDQTPRMMLVQSPEATLRNLIGTLREWILVPEETVQLPDPRPKLKR